MGDSAVGCRTSNHSHEGLTDPDHSPPLTSRQRAGSISPRRPDHPRNWSHVPGTSPIRHSNRNYLGGPRGFATTTGRSCQECHRCQSQ